LFREEWHTKNIVEYLGFGYIASHLRDKGVKVDIIDAYAEGLDLEDVHNRLSLENYDIIGFTIMSSQYFLNMRSILDKFSKEQLDRVHITVGGYYPSFNQEELMLRDERIDSVIVGEGELTFWELIKALASGSSLTSVYGIIYRDGKQIIKNEKRRLMADDELDKLPYPSRDALKYLIKEKKEAQILSSRGCFGRCSFCAVNSYFNSLDGKKWRGRTPENVVNEIECLTKDYGIKYIYFADEEFIGPGLKGQARAKEIARLIIDKNLNIRFCIYCRTDSVEEETFELLKKAGLDIVFLGVEFGVQSLLDFYQKGITVERSVKALRTIKKLKIKTSIGYIMFEPLMDIDTFRKNLKFYVENINFKLRHVVSKLAIYRYSPVYEKLKPKLKMNTAMTFDQLLGDHYLYEFKDRKVDFLYRLFKDCLPIISPSKKYRRIITELPLEVRNTYVNEWTEGIYGLMDGIAEEISYEENLSDESYNKYKAGFEDKLIAWDNKPINYNSSAVYKA